MIFKVTAKKKGHIVAEYLYELEETATIFANRMREKGFTVIVEKIASHD